MPAVEIVDSTRNKVGETQLADEIFDADVRLHLMHDVVKMQLANRRRGTACTKGRSDVRGGGRKPWRQKGTGRARVGTIRSPLWRGGGTVFGPLPRDYSYKVPKKVKRSALRSALSQKLKEDRLVVTMSDAVLFDVNSAALKANAQTTLTQMAEVMVNYPETDILVKGHTDSKGSESYNQELSERRSKAVTNYLITKGIPTSRITAVGFGETMPVASNDTSEGRQQNRRVEIEIKPRPEPETAS